MHVCMLILVLCFLSISGDAAAIPACKADFDSGTEMVTVTGNVGEDGIKQLSLSVLNKSYLTEDWEHLTPLEQSATLQTVLSDLDGISDNNFGEMIHSFRQVETRANGTFTCSFKLTADESRDYIVLLNHKTNEQGFTLVDSFFYSTPANVAQAVGYVNGADTDTIQRQLLDYQRELSLNMSLYDTLDNKSEQPLVAQYVLTARNALPKDTFIRSGEIQNSFFEGCLFYKLRSTENGTALGRLLTEHEIFLKLDSLQAFKTYQNTLDDSGRQAVLQSCLGLKDCDNMEEFKKLFCSKVIVQAVLDAVYWSDIKPIMLENKSHLSAVNPQYFNMRDTSTVDKAIVRQTFENTDKLAKRIESLLTPTPDIGSPGRGSGGGSTPVFGSGSKQPSTDNPKENDVQNTFYDMEGYSWAAQAVNELSRMGIINGRTADSFAPADNITRDEFVKMLVGLLGLYDTNSSVIFADVRQGEWYYHYVASAYENGIITGMDNGNFGVGHLISRQDICVMVSRGAGMSAVGGGKSFSDYDSIDSYARESVKALSSNGIIFGMNDDLFAPKMNATRAQAAKILFELYNWKEKTE